MRKVAFALLAMAALLVGCTSIECSMNNTVVSQYCFMQHCDEGNDTTIWLDRYYLTVSVNHIENGADTVYLNKQGKTTTLKLPVSYAYKNDTLFFEFQDTVQSSLYNTVAIDTVCISKTNDLVFEGVECNPRYHHKVLSATTTHNLIDSIIVNDNYIDNDPNKVHFYLYLHPSD